MHDIYIKVWNAETSAYDSIAENQIVAINLRTLEREYWSFGAIFNNNIEYVYHSATVRNAGGYAGNTNIKIVDASLSTNYSDFAQQAFKGCTNLHTVRIGDSQDGYKLDGPQYGCLFLSLCFTVMSIGPYPLESSIITAYLSGFDVSIK